MDKPLEEMNHKELLAIATALDVPRRHNLKRDLLEQAIRDAQAAPPKPPPEVLPELPPHHRRPTLEQFVASGYLAENYETHLAETELELRRRMARGEPYPWGPTGPSFANPDAPALEGPGEASDVPTQAVQPSPVTVSPEDALRILRATTEKLREALEDTEEPLAPHHAAAIRAELARRAEAERQEKAAQALKGPVDQFVVTKGGYYVTLDGHRTELRAGSAIGPLTHNLEHVKSQGIEFRPARGVQVSHGQLGERHVRVV